jgi:hypothetical protein
MKLSSQDVERTLARFNAEPVPNDHPVIEDLRDNFGDHTFFLHQNGLHIVEPGEPYTEGASTGRVGGSRGGRMQANRVSHHTSGY